jgi:hypothetical protein
MAKSTNKTEFYLGNPNLPAADAQIAYEPWMIKEIKKCRENILYFAEKYFYIINLDRGRETISLHSCQKRVMRKMRDNRFFILLASRQIGKALALETPIATPTGWTTMENLQCGDQVYGVNGKPCNVVKAHDVLFDRDCYRVTFDNNAEIIADSEHLWFTQTRDDRRYNISGRVRTTKEILCTLETHGNEPNHRIPSCINGVGGVTSELPISPYVLGLWLGDGASAGSGITVGSRDITEIVDRLQADKQFDKLIIHEYRTKVFTLRPTVHKGVKTKSLSALLKSNNLHKNKHIPQKYLFAGREQRLELLRGLIDSDGYVSKTGICQFYNTNYILVNQVRELVESLGYKVTEKAYIPKLNGVECAPAKSITFKPIEDICYLSFKRKRICHREKQNNSKLRSQWHYIKSIESVPSQPVRCITVDSKDNLFLAGRQYIPTHNSTLMTIYILWYACFMDDQRVLLVANKEATAIEIFQRVRMAFEELPIWLKPGVKEYGKTSMTLDNGSRIGITTTTGTAARGQSVNLLIIDEAAFIESHLIEEFWKSVFPIITSSKKSKVFICSTANGTGNLFHKLYDGAEKGENGWGYDKIMWNEVPGRDEKWATVTKQALGSTEAWLQEFNSIDYATLIDIEGRQEMQIGELFDELEA